MPILGESQFYKACLLLWFLLQSVGARKIIFGASDWGSGCQRTYIQVLGESQFYKMYFLLGLLLKSVGLERIMF